MPIAVRGVTEALKGTDRYFSENLRALFFNDDLSIEPILSVRSVSLDSTL
jgi:hypothetical protein